MTQPHPSHPVADVKRAQKQDCVGLSLTQLLHSHETIYIVRNSPDCDLAYEAHRLSPPALGGCLGGVAKDLSLMTCMAWFFPLKFAHRMKGMERGCLQGAYTLLSWCKNHLTQEP